MKTARKKQIKLGESAIREAKLTVKAMQMIYDGRYPALQTTIFLNALQHITVHLSRNGNYVSTRCLSDSTYVLTE
ncbi:MAG: hypothetical protein Q4A74_07565 [Cardiobacteriaceae bacterium]|nr:hypothetical protein [Cardiobacteriaceae bacterium]